MICEYFKLTNLGFLKFAIFKDLKSQNLEIPKILNFDFSKHKLKNSKDLEILNFTNLEKS